MKETKPDEIFGNYDPERAREALRKSAGVLADVDRRALLADIHAARMQQRSRRKG